MAVPLNIHEKKLRRNLFNITYDYVNYLVSLRFKGIIATVDFLRPLNF